MCYWTPVCELCTNHEVVMFQPRSLNPPKLSSVAYCYMAYLLNPLRPILLPSCVRPGGAAHSCPASSDINFRHVNARDHPPTRASPISVPEYQKTFTYLPLTRSFQSPTPPPLPFPGPRHACQITVASAPLLLSNLF